MEAGNMKTRILIVEDESIVALDLQTQLTCAGFQVIGPVDSYSEAVALATADSQDLILMDIRLKGSETGIDAVNRIREKNATPVIFLSALSDRDTLHKVEQISDTQFIKKPFSISELISVIEKINR